MNKKLLSLLLTIVLFITAFASLGLSTDAADKEIAETGTKSLTLAQVKSWLDNELSYRSSKNPVGGGECVEFANYYLTNCWDTPAIGGNARDWKNKCPEGWTQVDLKGSFSNCQVGDLIVEDYNPWGHVCVYYGYDSSDGYHYVVDQNNEYGRYVAKHKFYHPFENPTYCFRANCIGLPFTPADVGTDFYANILSRSTDMPITISGDNVVLGLLSGDDNQKWRFERQSDTTYKIINVATGSCLDDENFGSDNGNNIHICVSNDSDAQRWYIKSVENGYSIVPKCAVNSCMDIDGGITEKGRNIHLFAQNSTAAQIFYLNYQPAATACNFGNRFTASIINIKSGMAVDVSGSDNVCIKQYSGNNSQKWLFERMNDKSYKITNISTNKVIDDENLGTENGTNIHLCLSNNSFAQRWYIIEVGKGYSLIPKCASESAMDIQDGMISDGRNIQLYTQNSSTAQTFVFNFDISPNYTSTFEGKEYELYNLSLPWAEAYKFCEQKGGHLVTITSSDEQKFVTDNLLSKASKAYIWIGATDSLYEGNWKWITGETMSYTCWDSGEPNNYNDEDYLLIYKSTKKWNDGQDSFKSTGDSYSFICEYDSNYDAFGLSAEKTFDYNGHRYEVYSNRVGWSTAKQICEQLGGHLVTINSSNENSMIQNNTNGLKNERYWIGYSDLSVEGKWGWITGETNNYSNWADGEPNNTQRIEDCAEIVTKSGKWNDIKGFSCINLNIGFICEYDEIIPDPTEPTQPPTSPSTETPTTPPTEPTVIKLGDVDGDDEVTIIDATCIQRKLASIPTAKFIEAAADADEDGSLSIIDATTIQRWLAQLPSNANIGKPIN